MFMPGYSASRESVDVFFSPDGGAEKAIKNALNNAQSEILVAMYHFTSRELAYALSRAKRRGVEVTVVLDKSQSYGDGPQDEYLLEKGIDVRYMNLPYEKDPRERAKFHHKFAVIDGARVITGSYNWTSFADTDNYENVVIIHSPDVAALFRKEFVERILTNSIKKESAEEKDD